MGKETAVLRPNYNGNATTMPLLLLPWYRPTFRSQLEDNELRHLVKTLY